MYANFDELGRYYLGEKDCLFFFFLLGVEQVLVVRVLHGPLRWKLLRCGRSQELCQRPNLAPDWLHDSEDSIRSQRWKPPIVSVRSDFSSVFRFSFSIKILGVSTSGQLIDSISDFD